MIVLDGYMNNNVNSITVRFDDGTIISVNNDMSYSHDTLFKEAQHRYKLLKRKEKLKKILKNV